MENSNENGGMNGWNANDDDEEEQGIEGRTNQRTRNDDEERQGVGEHRRDERHIILRETYEQILDTHGLAQGMVQTSLLGSG